MFFKGIIHVHSNYSYDGQHSLAEIARHGKERGYQFIGMSEHSDTLDQERVAEYVEECKKVSGPDLLVIPGIEFTCENNLHLVGLGVRCYLDAKDPIKVAHFIREQNKVSFIAHPVRYGYQLPPHLAEVVDGIEVWNAGYDSRFVPNDVSLKLLKEIRRNNRSILAFGGQDLHRLTDHWYVEMTVSCKELTEEAILQAFRNGNATLSNPCFRIDSKNETGWLRRTQIGAVRKTYWFMRGIRDYLKSKIKR